VWNNNVVTHHRQAEHGLVEEAAGAKTWPSRPSLILTNHPPSVTSRRKLRPVIFTSLRGGLGVTLTGRDEILLLRDVVQVALRPRTTSNLRGAL